MEAQRRDAAARDVDSRTRERGAIVSAYKDHRDGTWRYRKRIQLPDGRKVRIKGTPPTNTQKSAEDAERDHIERLIHPERFRVYETALRPLLPESASRVPTLRTFAVRFLAEYAPHGKPRTKESRRNLINNAIVPFFGHLHLDAIDQSHVNAFVQAHKGRGQSTINNKLTALSTLLEYAVQLRIIEAPRLTLHVKMTTKASTEIKPIAMDDVGKLVHAARGDQRYVVAIYLATEAGLRIGEIRGLQWTDIKARKLTVRRSIDAANNHTGPKNGKPRTIPISPRLAEALDALPRRGLWVLSRLAADASKLHGAAKQRSQAPGAPLGYTGMLGALRRFYVAAGLEPDDDETSPWHSLRHTFGTQLAAQGVPVPTIQRLMDHADIKTTMRYVSTSSDQMDAAIERAFGR